MSHRILGILMLIALCNSPLHAQGRRYSTGVLPPSDETKAWLQKNAPEIKAGQGKPFAALPAKVMNLTYLPVTGDQGAYGTCAAFAVSYYYKTYQEAREHGWVNPDPSKNPERVMSPFFTYNLNNGGKDGGMAIGSALQTLVTHGSATWQELPYQVRNLSEDYTDWPGEAVWRSAIRYRAKAVATINYTDAAGLALLKQHLAGGDVAVFSLLLHENFVSYPQDTTGVHNGVLHANTGAIYMPPGQLSSYHALTLVGYDDAKTYTDDSGTTRTGAFLAVNSWGGWGVAAPGTARYGFIWIAYPCLQSQTDGAAYTMTDRAGYAPTTYGVYGLEHGRRRDLSISITGGSKSAPDWDFACYPGGGGNWPVSGRIVVDLSDFVQQYRSAGFYLNVFDMALNQPQYQPPETGLVTEFRIEQADGLGTPLVSPDAPRQTVDHDPTGGGAFANIRLYAGLLDNQPQLPGRVELQSGSHAWCDYDGDGDLDLACCGNDGTSYEAAGYKTRIYRNDGHGVFTDIAAELTGVGGFMAWGDYDNDGLADLAIRGGNSISGPPVTRLYHNMGGDLFIDSGVALPADKGTLAWVDYDNDGRLDLALFKDGYYGNPGGITLYHNDGVGKFSDSKIFFDAEAGRMAWADYDNDGWVDVAIMGGLKEFSYYSDALWIMRNNHDGTFTRKFSLAGGSDGALAWGDYNNDGWLDLVELSPYTGGSHLYKNNGGTAFTDSGVALPKLYDPALAWGDFDNDGRLDLALFGDLLEKDVVHKAKFSAIYLQYPAGTFKDIGADLPPMSGGSISWADLDGDGDLDLCLSGYGIMQPDPSPYPLPSYTRIYRSNAGQAPLGLARANTPPTAPTVLAATASGAPAGGVKLTWSAPADTQTTRGLGLYYNVRAGTMPGWSNVLSGAQATPLLGGRLRPMVAATAPGVILKTVPASGIYWSVQAIDTGLAASAWSTPKFFGTGVRGDLNNDGKVDVADLVLCIRMANGQATVDLAKADLSGDGKISELDALMLRGLILEAAQPNQGIIEVKTIGTGGGTLTATGVAVRVSAGTFAAPVTLALRRADGDRPYGADSVSGSFSILGLPEVLNKAITIQIKADKATSGKTYGIFGETVFVPSLNTMRRVFRPRPATLLAGGYYSFDLPAAPAGALKPARDIIVEAHDPLEDYTFTYTTGLLSNYAELTGSHFNVIFPQSIPGSDITTLATYLEEAYGKFKTGSAYNFSYAARTSWPMSVTVSDLGAGTYGYFTASKLGNNYGTMEFNSTMLKNTAELRVTVGHEFFHFVQSLYDPRNRFSRAILESANYWVDEASAVWTEELFNATPDTYISSVYTPNMLEPTLGMHAGAQGGNAAAHGYGMAPLLKYLVKKKGDGLPLKLYTSLQGGTGAVDAVQANSPTPADPAWLQDFFIALLKGDLYKMSLGDLGQFAPAARRMELKTDADVKVSKTFKGEAADLSGQIFMTVPYAAINLPASAQLSHRLKVANPQDFALAVLKAKTGAATELVAMGTADVMNGSLKLDIGNLAQLKTDGWRLITVVTDKRKVAPYTGKSPYTLTIGVTDDTKSIPLTTSVVEGRFINGEIFPKFSVGGTVTAGGLCDVNQQGSGGFTALVASALGETPASVGVALSCNYAMSTKDVPQSIYGGTGFDRWTAGPIKKYRLQLMDTDPFVPVQTIDNASPTFNLTLDKGKQGFTFNIYAYYDVTAQPYNSEGTPSGAPTLYKDLYYCVFIGYFVP